MVRTRLAAILVLTALTLSIAGCSDNDWPPAVSSSSTGPASGVTGEVTESPATGDRILVDAASPGAPIDRRIMGVNLPAWLGPAVLGDPVFRQIAVESGTTVVRMPGGSWSNVYDWLGCERADEDSCFWTWAARPSDFIDFVEATGLDAMWTLSVNDTAQKSAAAVAFFNGDVDDTTVIGIDRDGVDWGQVGDWARLRAAGGHPAPVPIGLWEIGNEVYGGRPADGGDQCASFGWEEVWTCDGTDYVEGVEGHDGALAIREAMLAVDPTIEVGFVGVSDPSSWSNWGAEVIAAAGDALDFYAVHHYGFDRSPAADDAVDGAGEAWSEVTTQARAGLPPGTELALTEYNLVSVESGDTQQSMTRAMNAFFLAESIGRLAEARVELANWWNLANGVTSSGTDYGLVELDGPAADPYPRTPAFHAFEFWGRTGTELLEVVERPGALRVFATRHDDGSLTILVINPTTESVTTDLVIAGDGGTGDLRTTLESIVADDLEATTVAVSPATELDPTQQPALEIEPRSLNLIEVDSP